MKYAIRLNYGRDGHGDAVLVASGETTGETERNCICQLQAEYGGAWSGQMKDVYIGSLAWLEENFPTQRGRITPRGAIEAIEERRNIREMQAELSAHRKVREKIHHGEPLL